MHYFADFTLFFTKTMTAFVFILLLAMILFSMSRNQSEQSNQIKLIKLNDYYKKLSSRLQKHVLDKKALKQQLKKNKKAEKTEANLQKPNVFVAEFIGNLRADAVHSLREVITAILLLAKPRDEVVIILESPGGMVPHYGLAASELARIKAAGLTLTVIIDKVAASGGYLMAVVADRIIAAPFAIVGSIGVVYQLPNFNQWLKSHDIHYELLTAGEYKRTLTMFGENTKQGREKVLEDLDVTHELFKDFIHKHRPQVNLDEVATGEYWYASKAMKFHMVDDLMTSDDYLLAASTRANIFKLSLTEKKSLGERIISTFAMALDTLKLSLHKRSDLPDL